MGKQSRLRTKRDQGRRPAILLVILLFAAIASVWYFVDFQQLFRKIGDFFDVAEKSMDAGSDTRGIIYDRNFKELAVSLEKVSVVARMRDISSLAETAAQLSSVLRIDSQQILERLRDDSPRTWVVQNISQQQEEAVRRLKIPGISLTEEKARFYPQEETAAHLIGFAENDIGLSGIEYYYDSLLSRHSAVKEENVAHLRGFPHLVLTIDLKIQGILENLIATLVARQTGVRASAYLMDAGSGAIVASVQHPSYNPNNYREYPAEVLTSMFLEPLLLPVGIRRFLRDASLLNTHYEANGAQLPWSLVAKDESLGSQVRLWDRIGLNEPMPPEFIEDSQALTATGGQHEIVAGEGEAFDTIPEFLTPLQLMTAVTCLINSGEKVRARAVSQLVDPETKKEYPLPGRQENLTDQQTVSAQTSREILRLLAAQSKKGQLDSISFEQENIVASDSGALWNLRNRRLLLSVVPSLHPELVLLVLLDTPAIQAKGQKIDQQDLASAVDGVVQRISALQQVSMTVSDVVSPAERRPGNFIGAKEEAGQDARIRVGALDKEERVFTMPDLKGKSLRKALRELGLAEARIRIVGTGKVTSQDPKPGEVVAKNGEVVLFLQKEEDIQVKRLEKRESMLESHD
jgi:cell division protein FtsI (penicillin-binding protein 3)